MIARARRFFYIYSYYIYIPVSSSLFLFILKSKVVFFVLLLFLNGKVVVFWLFFSSFPKNDVSPEKRESSVVVSFGLSFPERKKDRKKATLQKFFPNVFFLPSSKSVTKNSVERGIIIQYCCR